MKFTDGNWLIREGYSVSGAVQAYDFAVKGNTLTAYASTAPIPGRGATINAQLITVQFHSPAPASSALSWFTMRGTRSRSCISIVWE